MRNGFRKIMALLTAVLMLLAVLPAGAEGTEQYSDSVIPGISLLSILPSGTPVATYIFCNGAAEYHRQAVKDGETLLEPEAPEAQAGKVFSGWYTQQEGGERFANFGAQTVTESKIVKLYARFTNAYYVYFYTPDGGTLKHTEVVTDNTQICDFSGVTYDAGSEKKVTGWAAELNGSEDVSKHVKFEEGATSVSLYAIETSGYWVVFHTGEGTSVAPKFVKAGQTLDLLNVKPSCTGYSFDGWYGNKELEGAAVSQVSSAAELYAKWTPTNTTVKLIYMIENADDTGYSYRNSKNDVSVTTGAAAATVLTSANTGTGNLNTATLKDSDYFTYDGEKTQQANAGVTIAGDGSTVIKLYYSRNSYTVKFDLGRSWIESHTLTIGGNTYSSGRNKPKYSITAKYEASIGEQWPTAANFETGSNFAGWKANRDNKILTSRRLTMTADICSAGTITAQYDASCLDHLYYMFESLDQTSPANGNVRKQYNGKYYDRSTEYSQDAYSAGGNWNLKQITGMTSLEQITENVNENFHLIERNVFLYYSRNAYSLSFDTRGGTTVIAPKTLKFGARLKDEKPTSYVNGETTKILDGITYYFDGWYNNAECAGTEFDFANSTMPGKNLELYAKWVSGTFTVSFNLNGPEGTIAPQTVSAGAVAQQPDDPIREGFKFIGWYDGEELFSFYKQILKDTRLTAHWLSNSTFNVAYNANGGGGAAPTDDTAYADGAGATLKDKGGLTAPDDPTKAYFLGWSTDPQATTAKYQSGEVMTIEADKAINGVITLYAVWGPKPGTTTLTYNANYEGANPATVAHAISDGTATGTTTVLPNNATITLYPETTFTRTGYKLLGWAKTADAQTAEYQFGKPVIVDNDLEEGEANILYAVWERATVDVTITKQVTGNMGDRSKSFSFSVQSSAGMGEGDGYALSDDARTATFTLSHSGFVTLRSVPIGATLTISESDAAGYTMSVAPNNGAKASAAYTIPDTAEAVAITVTNDREGAPDTGILLDSLPYILILAVVIGISAILFIRKRRKINDD